MIFKKKIRLVLLVSILLGLSSLFIFSFLWDSFKVVSVSPKGDVYDKVKSIEIRFSKPLIGLKSVQSMINLKVSKFLKISPLLKGQLQYKSRNSLIFRINKSSLKANRRYQVIVKSGIKALSGSKLDYPYRFSFNNSRFILIGSNLRRGVKLDSLKTSFYLYFNHQLKRRGLSDHITLESDNGDSVKVRIKEVRGKKYGRSYLSTRFVTWRQYRKLYYNKKYFVYQVDTGKLKKDTSYTLTVNNSLQAKVGNLSLVASKTLRMKTYAPNRILSPKTDRTTMRPNSRFYISFSNGIKGSSKELRKKVRVRNLDTGKFISNFEITHYSSSSYVYIYVKGKPGEEYEVTFDRNFKDVYGQQLTGRRAITAEVLDYYPNLSIPYPSNAIIESYGKINAMPMSFINLLGLTVEIKSYHSPEEYISDSPSKVYRPNYEDKISRRNINYVERLKLTPYLRNRHFGILKIKVNGDYKNARGYNYTTKRNLILQFSSLSLTMKYGPKNIFIYATRLRTGKSAGRVKITLYSKNKNLYKRIYRGRTKSDGSLIIPIADTKLEKYYKRYTYNNEIVAIAKKGQDFCILDNGSSSQISLYNTIAAWPGKYMQDLYSYIFTPKGLYKKSEEVVIKGYVRQNQGGKLVNPVGMKIQVSCKAPGGKVVLDKKVTLSQFGSFDLKYKLPKDAKLGRYSISLSEIGNKRGTSYDGIKGYGHFMVESYRPREFEVGLIVGKGSKKYKVGDKIPFLLSGKYLFGGVMQQAKSKYRIKVNPYFFRPAINGAKGFSYSSTSWIEKKKKFAVVNYTGSKIITRENNLKLDKNGRANYWVKGQSHYYSSASYKIMAEVEDKNRQSVSIAKNAVVHKGDFYIGYRIKNDFIGEGKYVKIDLLGVTPNKKIVSIPVEVKIYRIEWNNVRKLSAGGVYKWHYEKKFKLVKSMRLRTAHSVRRAVSARVKIKKPGYYMVTLASKDRKGRKITNTGSFWVWGSGFAPWKMDDEQIIELVRDKKNYKPGESAKIMVKSPYKRVEALITVEREGVKDVYRRVVKGSAGIIRVPIKKSYAPNVFVSVMLLQGRIGNKMPLDKLKDIYKPTVKIGYTVLYVSKKHKKIVVSIKANKKKYSPGDKVRLRFKTTGYRGRGVKTELAVFVVDEAVLSLIDYKTPNPFVVFYKNRDLLLRTYDNRLGVLGQHHYKLKGETPGGGAGMKNRALSSRGLSNISVRKIFKAIAYSNPSVITSRSGHGVLSFKLPDNLTKFRIMVVAVDRWARFGSGELSLRVTKDLIIRPALSRFLNIGDKMFGGAIVDNNTDKSGRIDLYAKVKGIKLIGRNRKTIRLPAHGSKEIRFNFLANKKGKAKFDFTAVMYQGRNNLTDRIQMSIPVQVPHLKLVSGMAEVLDGRFVSTPVTFPKNVFPGSRSFEILLSSTALNNLRGGVEYLYKYPYGCLEQRISRMIPFIIGENIISSFKLAGVKAFRKIVQNNLDLFKSFQDASSGGFYYWPETTYQHLVSPYLSSVAFYTMTLAKRGGYKVNSSVYAKAKKYLKKMIASGGFKSKYKSYYSDRYWNAANIVAFSMLMKSGFSDRTLIDSLDEYVDEQPVYIKILFAEILHKIDKRAYRSRYRQLISAVMGKLKYQGSYAYIEEDGGNYSYYRWFYLSNTKSTAAFIEMMIDVDRRNPLIPKLVRGLMRKMKNGRWRTTQENQYVFRALAKYFKTYEKIRPNFKATVSVKGQKIFAGSFRGREFKILNKLIPFIKLLGRGVKKKVKLQKVGKGRLYYTYRMNYIPKKLPSAINRGFDVDKKIYNVSGRKQVKNGRFVAGRVYKVVLNVSTEMHRYNVVVDDPLPAGFEAVNPKLKGNPLSSGTTGGVSRGYYWWRSGFNRVAIHDDRVTIFANELSSGKYSYVYYMKATTVGKFNMFPTKAEEMYYPEVFGTTGSGRIIIK